MIRSWSRWRCIAVRWKRWTRKKHGRGICFGGFDWHGFNLILQLVTSEARGGPGFSQFLLQLIERRDLETDKIFNVELTWNFFATVLFEGKKYIRLDRRQPQLFERCSAAFLQ